MLMAALSGQPAACLGANDTSALVTGNTAFAFDLYARLKGAQGNLFFAPYSISTCLAMTYDGARGSTATQMARTLHFDADQARLAASFGELQRQLGQIERAGKVELNVANGLWAQQGHPFLPAFLNDASNTYQAKLEQADFRTAAEPARAAINQWVSDQTRGKITNLLQPGVVDPATRLVLVNAIYFKGQWAHPFDKGHTSPAPFTVTPERKVQAPLMNQTANFQYAEPEGLQLLAMPYGGDDLSMVVLLPRTVDGLPGLEARLNAQTLANWLASAHDQKVNVFLPRFKLTA